MGDGGVGMFLMLGFGIAWMAGAFSSPKLGTLVLEVDITDPDLFIDGEPELVKWGKEKRAELHLSPGAHRVEIRKDGFATYEKEVTIEAGKEVTILASLNRTPYLAANTNKKDKPQLAAPRKDTRPKKGPEKSQPDNDNPKPAPPAVPEKDPVAGEVPPEKGSDTASPEPSKKPEEKIPPKVELVPKEPAKKIEEPIPAKVEDPILKPGRIVEFEITKGVKMKFCWIPAGEAQLGAPQTELADLLKSLPPEEAESMQMEAQEKRPKFKTPGFWMGKYEVTQGEWQAVMKNNPSYFSLNGKGSEKIEENNTSRYPVDTVSWNDCQDFLLSLTSMAKPADVQKVFGRRGKFVLPNENEWEYACRGGLGNEHPFYFGMLSREKKRTLMGHCHLERTPRGRS